MSIHCRALHMEYILGTLIIYSRWRICTSRCGNNRSNGHSGNHLDAVQCQGKLGYNPGSGARPVEALQRPPHRIVVESMMRPGEF